MTTPYLLADIKSDEGCRLLAYPDPLSHGPPWTIGFGHTGPEVHPGLLWTMDQAADALASDVGRVQQGLDTAMAWWRQMVDARQDVFVNAAFNLGVHGLLAFKNTLAAAKAGDYAEAAAGLLASRWATQVGHRAVRLADQMRTGVRA